MLRVHYQSHIARIDKTSACAVEQSNPQSMDSSAQVVSTVHLASLVDVFRLSFTT